MSKYTILICLPFGVELNTIIYIYFSIYIYVVYLVYFIYIYKNNKQCAAFYRKNLSSLLSIKANQ